MRGTPDGLWRMHTDPVVSRAQHKEFHVRKILKEYVIFWLYCVILYCIMLCYVMLYYTSIMFYYIIFLIRFTHDPPHPLSSFEGGS